ncbi:MAG: zeta-carotene-forming phytoene desaturase [Tenericutes bacterium ADurb.Bin087]|nr:MAG: zeta-carotene-forming phytoene desaturase [Tenericutes bacterium ADurb.Bin087]
MKVIIIGAGLAGLTYGALAAKDGHEVIIIDKNSKPGGVVALLEHEGYKFEQGPLLIGDMLEGEPVYEFLKTLGITLKTMRADRDNSFPDFKILRPEKYEGPYWRRDYLAKLFPEDKKGLDKYYKYYDDVLRLRYLTTLPQTIVTKIRTGLAFLKVKKYMKMNADELTKHFFTNEKLRTVFTAILADFCADPTEVNGLFTVFTNLETAFDLRIPLTKKGKKYYPGFCFIEGGVQKLPEALAAFITSHGGKFIYNTIVDKVLIENGRAIGVKLNDNTTINGDYVIGVGAAKDFFSDLVGHEHLTEEYIKILDTMRPMEGVFMLHLGIDIDPLKYLRSSLIYCYGMYDLSAATYKLRNGIYHEGDDGYLLFVPSYHAPDFAPEGRHALTIYTVAPDTLKDANWESKQEEYAKKLIKLAEAHIPNLSKHIKVMKIMTPVDYRHFTHMKKSSFGGIVPIWNQKAPTHFTPVKNLLFLGQQSENAGGMGPVILGAKRAFEQTKFNK